MSALPAHIGRFRILGVLGQGAMGVVYRGRDEALERDAAIKVMSVNLAGDEEGRQRFRREARAAARLQHPNIVTIYELGEQDGAPFIAMELLEGIDLKEAIARGLRPDPRVTLPIVIQLLAGLGHAHESRIVHRDVKPSNVFLPRGQPVKIMDFGVARLGGTSAMTGTGLVIGTPHYMSPEQARGASVDTRSDIFSAGLILYELVTGERAYTADTLVSLLYKITHEDPNLSALPRGEAWTGVRRVLDHALARDPSSRYPAARIMAADLKRLLADLGGSPDRVIADDYGLVGRVRPVSEDELPPVDEPAALSQEAPAADRTADTAPRLAIAAGALGAGLAVLVAVAAALFVFHPWRPARPGIPSPVPSVPTAGTPRPPATDTLVWTPSPPPAPRPEPTSTATATASATEAPALSSPASTTMVAPAGPTTPAVAPTAATLTTPRTATPRPAAAGRLPTADHASDLLGQGRYRSALDEARAVLAREPGNEDARLVAEDAEVLLNVEGHLRRAREAVRSGDPAAARQAIDAGLALAPNDARLLALQRELGR
jgi:hypothetical protein